MIPSKGAKLKFKKITLNITRNSSGIQKDRSVPDILIPVPLVVTCLSVIQAISTFQY